MAAAVKPRREKTPEEAVDGVRRQIAALERRAVKEDPWMPADMFGLAAELEAAAVRVIASYRRVDPSTGLPAYRWEDIGFSLGLSDTTCIHRYKRHVDLINAWPAPGTPCTVAARRGTPRKGKPTVTLEVSNVPGRLYGPFPVADAASSLFTAGLLDQKEARELTEEALASGYAERQSGGQ